MKQYIWPVIVSISLLIMASLGDWNTVFFVISFAGIYGGVLWIKRERVRKFLKSRFKNRTAGVILVGAAVSTLEELYCYVLGIKMANPLLWADMIIVVPMWTIWFLTWHLFLSKRFSFSEKEYLMAAGSTGLLFEFSGSGISSPLGAIVMAPLTISIYMAIFLLPSLLMDFNGESDSRVKYPVSIFLPYILMIPLAFLVFPIISLFGA